MEDSESDIEKRELSNRTHNTKAGIGFVKEVPKKTSYLCTYYGSTGHSRSTCPIVITHMNKNFKAASNRKINLRNNDLLNQYLDVIPDNTNMSSHPPSPQTSHDPSSVSSPDLTTLSPPLAVVQRRSHRVNKIPSHLNDYIVSIPSLKPHTATPQNS
ncbi:hypothetical protein H5410_024179 [Solanum commersonii]|uniref:Uncharacterized protein n=1 Tax=Solanum commersonii TaxID=4109 RepID=A0A9J5ZL87_SOLCO|nr:hypothetical protein H5410_024179 [Solanum commersonii]